MLAQLKQRLPDPCFIVMDELIRRIDSREARFHRLQHQLGCGFFFPRCAVHEGGNRDVIIGRQWHFEGLLDLLPYMVHASGLNVRIAEARDMSFGMRS